MKELLAAKLAVMEKVRRVEKGKKMATASGGYQYVGIDDLVGEIRPAMVVNGLSLIPTKSEMLVNDRLQLAGGKTMTHVIVKMTYRLAHISGQFEEAEAIGEGADSMDKAASKAQTAALKYALLHTFLLQGAHDDPDDYASQDQEPHQQAKTKPTQNPPPRTVNATKPTEADIKAMRAEIDAVLHSLPGYAQWPEVDEKASVIIHRFLDGKFATETEITDAIAYQKKWLACAWVTRCLKDCVADADFDIATKMIQSLAAKLGVPSKWSDEVQARIREARQNVAEQVKAKQAASAAQRVLR